MNEFLLHTDKSFEFDSSDIDSINEVSLLETELDGLHIIQSQINKSDFKPNYKDNQVFFFSVGIIYIRGKRIDKCWSIVKDLYFENLSELANELDGYGNLILYDCKSKKGHIIISRMGFYALFAGKDLEGTTFSVGTNPDRIASCFTKNKLDEVSIAEFIATSCITAPHTYYENIKQLDPATIYSFDRNGIQKEHQYWEPDIDHNDFLSEEESIKKIASMIRESVDKRIEQNMNKGLLLLSGGLDSRAVLFSQDNTPERIEAVTFYNEKNRELKLAAKLAKIAKVKHHAVQREYDYYGNLAIDTIKKTGGMWNFACFHTSGFNKELHQMNPGILLSGMYFDTFFKGFGFDKKIEHYKISGRIYKAYSNQNAYWDTRGVENISKEWKKKVHERRVEYYGYDEIEEKDLDSETLNSIKYSRIGNMARIRSGGMDNALYKSQHYEMVVSDQKFSEVFSFLDPKHEIQGDFMWRINQQLTDKKMVKDSNIANSEYLLQNYYLTVLQGIFRKRILNKFMGAKGKKTISIEASWIDFNKYIRESELMKKLWDECSDTSNSLIKDILGYNPYLLEPSQIRKKSELINLVTVGLWLKYGYAN